MKNAFAFAIAPIILGIFYFLAVSGIILSFRMGEILAQAFLVSMVLYVALISIPNPMSFVRYRAPVTPMLCFMPLQVSVISGVTGIS